jgi:hypothetical protein
MYKDNIAYARQRLLGTVVRIKDEPVKVTNISDKGIVTAHFLKDVKEFYTDLDNLNLEPVPLGYLNYRGSAYYVVRKPMREDWRQGLRIGNIAFIGEEGFMELPKEELRNTILNSYPTFSEAVEAVTKKKSRKVAFNRVFAVSSDKELLYKQRVVGSFDKLPHLTDKFRYLHECLQEFFNEKPFVPA